LEKRERLELALAFYVIIAWRVRFPRNFVFQG
jgi:hypothetical protein